MLKLASRWPVHAAALVAVLLTAAAPALGALTFGPVTPITTSANNGTNDLATLIDGRVIVASGPYAGGWQPVYTIRNGSSGTWSSPAPIPGLSGSGPVWVSALPGGGAIVLNVWRDGSSLGHAETAVMNADGS